MPYTYLIDVLQRISMHPANRAIELTPRMWKSLFADDPPSLRPSSALPRSPTTLSAVPQPRLIMPAYFPTNANPMTYRARSGRQFVVIATGAVQGRTLRLSPLRDSGGHGGCFVRSGMARGIRSWRRCRPWTHCPPIGDRSTLDVVTKARICPRDRVDSKVRMANASRRRHPRACEAANSHPGIGSGVDIVPASLQSRWTGAEIDRRRAWNLFRHSTLQSRLASSMAA